MSRSRKQRDKSMSKFHGYDDLSGKRFNTQIGNDFTDGHRGMARSVKGAKKFINSRRRFHEKAALHEIQNNQQERGTEMGDEEKTVERTETTVTSESTPDPNADREEHRTQTEPDVVSETTVTTEVTEGSDEDS